MKLVLQCSMCGTHHPVGTPSCTTCRATGVTQLRLMFECQTCGNLGINPVCEACPFIEPLELDDDLIIAEEVTDDSISLDPRAEEDDLEEIDFELDLDIDGEDEEAGEAVVVDLSEDRLDEDEEGDECDSDLENSDLDEEVDELDDLDEDREEDDEEDEEEEDDDTEAEDD